MTTGWDNKVLGAFLNLMLADIFVRGVQTDPACVDWYIHGQDIIVYMDARSLATSVIIENSGAVAVTNEWG